MARPRAALARLLTRQLHAWRDATLKLVHQLGKSEEHGPIVDRILAQIGQGRLVVLMNGAQSLLEEITADGGATALDQVGVTDDQGITDQVNAYAVEYSRDRSAEMVGMKWVDGELVQNPDESWRIDQATRDMLRADVTDAMTEGWSNQRLADVLDASYAFSEERALMIARTETAFADVAGNLKAYSVSGLVQSKEWLTGAGCCDECDALDHVVVGIDEDFPGDGGEGPPLHPNCRCDVLPVLIDQSAAGDE